MEVYYQSTRQNTHGIEAKAAVLQGISPDGGLYVWPNLGEEKLDLNEVCKSDYKGIASMVFNRLLSGYNQQELEECIDNAYSHTFKVDQPDTITPLATVGDVEVLELFRGPTSAFKDVALTILPWFLSKALAATNKKALILTATSGDTGKAAMSGFQDVDHTGICVFYPDGKVSAVQQKQMASQPGKNVRVFGVQGNFDDAQSMVKKLFLDEELRERLAREQIVLSSANSINIGRLIPQIVYYFDAYRQLVCKGKIAIGDSVSFSVPTGNFGDVLAGYYASLMGLPVEKFYVASNANNVLTDFLKTGVYDRNRPFIQTISPSMDILISSNLERLLYYASGKETDKVAGWMNDLATKGFYELDKQTKEIIQSMFKGGYYDDEALRKTIKDTYDATGYVLDPHTAAAYALAKEARKDSKVPVIALATASPYKFTQDVLEALGISQEDPWKAMEQLSAMHDDPIPAPLAALQNAPILHDAVIAPEEMKESVAAKALEIFQ